MEKSNEKLISCSQQKCKAEKLIVETALQDESTLRKIINLFMT